MPKFEDQLVESIERSEIKDLSAAKEIWADGGVILKNPSPFGGTWAWCAIDSDEKMIHCASGMFPAISSKLITNNDSEMVAVIKALEELPDNWSGDVFTDSAVTISRFQKIRRRKSHLITKIPNNVLERATIAIKRLGWVNFHLVKGHPKREDIDRGYRIKRNELGEERRLPVSKFNVWCDLECSKISLSYQETLEDLNQEEK